MRKWMALCFAAALVLSSGCMRVADGSKATSSADVITVNKTDNTVEFTIPSSFVAEGTTQESLNSSLAEGVSSATLNEDGSVTYVMTKEAHEKMMKETKKSVDESLGQIVNSDNFSTLTGIEHSDDYTDFTITTSASTEEELGTDALAAAACFLAGGAYNAFNATPADNISVTFVNESGTVITKTDSKEFLSGIIGG